ncbi:sensor histidine kinase [Tenacibaculum amylolyticum]|uniref:sensor histidine kinase n=1 Tax=Tenacibaculum amylolyticum TaxID=104269 RepID=UPI0038960149
MLIDTDYKSDTTVQKKKLHQIKKDADYLYSGMKDFVWSLDHKNDDLRYLQIYLNDFGEQLFSLSNISFYSTHNFTEQKTILPFYWSKQLVLIFKEAMTNTLKHSEATKVLLKFTLKGNKLKIMLKDDGSGFTINTLQRVNGIQNMKHRAKTLHQKLIIETTNGTTITFIGNLKKNTNEQA